MHETFKKRIDGKVQIYWRWFVSECSLAFKAIQPKKATTQDLELEKDGLL